MFSKCSKTLKKHVLGSEKIFFFDDFFKEITKPAALLVASELSPLFTSRLSLN